MFRIISALLIIIPSALCCGENFVVGRKEEVTLQSPHLSGHFPREVTCKWKISSKEGAGFNIFCPVMDLLPIKRCKYSRIQITSGTFAMNICASSQLDISVEGKSFDFKFTSSMIFDNYGYTGFSCVISVLENFSDESIPEITSPVTVPATQPISLPHRCNCGMKKTGRIIGGQEAALHEYPWQTTLKFKNNNILCGATLISERYVLTAAHCLEDKSADMLTVSLGEHDTTSSDETDETIQLKVSRMIVHEGYGDGINYNNDIALLQLSKPVNFTAAISPACLPYGVEEATLSGEMGIVTGWGSNKTWGSNVPILREVELPMMTTKECQKYLENDVTENMLCTYTPEKDSCKGDSGGPLIWSKDGSQYYLVGIVSWGRGCARFDEPGVYTKVTNYLKWIEMETKADFCSEIH